MNNIVLTKTEHKDKINASLNNLRLIKVKINLNHLNNRIKVMLEMQLCPIYVRFIEAEKKVRKRFQTLQMTEGNSPMPE